MPHHDSIKTSIEVASEFDFACPSCGHRARGTIQETGEGVATVGATSENAEDAAARRAQAVARRRIERALLLVRCPSCKQQDAEKVRRYTKGRLITGGVIAALFAPPLGWMCWAASDHAAWGLGLGLAGGFLLSAQALGQAMRPPEPRVDFAPPA